MGSLIRPLAALSAVLSFALAAEAEVISICDYVEELCNHRGFRSSSSPAYPSNNSRLNLNPSAVPMDKGYGFEGITYSAEWDFALVRGTGRIGAAFSPGNTEETFFGLPGLERSDDFLARRLKSRRFRSEKFVLATSVNLWSNRAKGLRRKELNLGLLGRYNRMTGNAGPGAGLSGVLGPFTFGASYSADESAIDYARTDTPDADQTRYNTVITSGGIYLSSVVLDYSRMLTTLENGSEIETTLLTGSLLLRHMIFILSRRIEDSFRPAYNPALRNLEDRKLKQTTFGGAQVIVNKRAMVGLFYNYYLLEDYSFGVTIFL